MPDRNTDDTEAPAFAGAEPSETPAGESPPLPDTADEHATVLAEAIESAHGAESDEVEAGGDVAAGGVAEDAPGSPEDEAMDTALAKVLADEEAAATAAESALQSFKAGGVPTVDTDHESAAYWNGHRAGGDDPGYLLTLAELLRHLGSFSRLEEEEAYAALNGDDCWSRWMPGYLDVAAGSVARLEAPRQREEMDW